MMADDLAGLETPAYVAGATDDPTMAADPLAGVRHLSSVARTRHVIARAVKPSRTCAAPPHRISHRTPACLPSLPPTAALCSSTVRRAPPLIGFLARNKYKYTGGLLL